jgi:hypothetical protein
MKPCLSLDELITDLVEPQLREMQRVGQAYPSANAPGACESFSRQVQLVNGAVRQTYGVAASLARKATDLAAVAEIWRRMGAFCQTALTAVAEHKHKYPDCGTPELYDLVLDYKLACEKRHRGAMEEIACQTTGFPKGLLPELK